MRDGRPRPTLWWLFGDTFRSEPITLLSPLGPAQVHRALETAGLTGWWRFGGNWTPLQGRATPTTVSASVRTSYRNSWSPVFEGRYGYHTAGVVLSGSIHVHVVVRWFIVSWCVAMTAVALLLSRIPASGGTGVPLEIWGFPAFGVALCHVGALLARREWDVLRSTLRDALQATEATGDARV